MANTECNGLFDLDKLASGCSLVDSINSECREFMRLNLFCCSGALLLMAETDAELETQQPKETVDKK